MSTFRVSRGRTAPLNMVSRQLLARLRANGSWRGSVTELATILGAQERHVWAAVVQLDQLRLVEAHRERDGVFLRVTERARGR